MALAIAFHVSPASQGYKESTAKAVGKIESSVMRTIRLAFKTNGRRRPIPKLGAIPSQKYLLPRRGDFRHPNEKLNHRPAIPFLDTVI